jgi:hypothetical protein
MLHTEALIPGTLPVLERLMRLPSLDQFYLVGGTALALRHGHRISVDIDLFGIPLDHAVLVEALGLEFGTSFRYEPPANKSIGIFCFIDEVKVDIVRYPVARITNPETVNGIRMYGDDDIGAMKIQAILSRGKKKDLWDLVELLEHHPLSHIIENHEQKFPSQMYAISTPNALIYFVDADKSEDPVCLKGRTWPEVKEIVRNAVDHYLR